MGLAEAFAILGAGAAAGAVNAVVGSGSLITFPTLLAFGFPPVVANVSNNVGLVPGNFSGACGYRRELAGPAEPADPAAAVLGAGRGRPARPRCCRCRRGVQADRAGADPDRLRAGALQPRLSARIAARAAGRGRSQAAATPGRERAGPVLAAGVFGAAVYGGYFGAAQGVLVIGLLGTFLDETLQRVNGAKNVLVGSSTAPRPSCTSSSRTWTGWWCC